MYAQLPFVTNNPTKLVLVNQLRGFIKFPNSMMKFAKQFKFSLYGRKRP